MMLAQERYVRGEEVFNDNTKAGDVKRVGHNYPRPTLKKSSQSFLAELLVVFGLPDRQGS